MSLKSWIAAKLCPQVFADQRAYRRMKAEATDAYHWLSAYGDAADALRWLLDNDRNHRRAIGEPAIGSLPSSIDRFRDLLERRHVSPPLEKRPAAFEVLDTDEGVYLTRSEIAAQRTGYEYNGLYRRDSAEAKAVPSPSTLSVGRGTPEYAAAEAAFTEYFVRNYPGPDTIIFDPKWHAPKLFAAALRAVSEVAA